MKFDLNHPITFSLPSSLLMLLLLRLLQNPIPVSGYVPTTLCAPNITNSNSTKYNALRPNLNTLLSSLSNNTPPTGFFNNTVGTILANQVYGLALCQGDLAPAQCQPCIDSAAREIVSLCPEAEGAVLWYDDCLMRYNTTNFFGSFTVIYVLSSDDNASDPMQLNVDVKSLTTRLKREAASSPLLFATAEANLTGSNDQKLYSLAQCTRDLTQGSCYDCLNGLQGFFATDASGRKGSKAHQGSCFMRYEMYPFYKYNVSTPNAPVTGKGNNSSQTALIVAMAVVTSLLLISVIYVIKLRKRNRVRRISADGDGNNEQEIGGIESLLFGLETLKEATNFFSDANKLGEGGFGPVYKGILPNAQEIAVKRLSGTSLQGQVELRNERKKRSCWSYEYLPNTSLDKFLFDPFKRLVLDWDKRYKIIEGIARGLLYLHEDSRLRIIHRDLKASNILLDQDMIPKISDFGLARLFGVDQTQGNTSRIAGTYGYMAPEYVIHGQFSNKSDVFSYGVLVLEILTGQRMSGFSGSENARDLLSYVWNHWNGGTVMQVLDQSLVENHQQHQVMRCIHIGLLCAQEDGADRPNMSSVVLMLNSYSLTLPAPSTPAFFHQRSARRGGGGAFDSTLVAESRNGNVAQTRPQMSANGMSVTELDPR